MLDPNILIVEDDIKITKLLNDYLVQAGFKVEILYRGDNVITEVKSNPPDLIILDIMLPRKDGITICKEIRVFSKVLIVMLTAKVDEFDRVLGLPHCEKKFIRRTTALLSKKLSGRELDVLKLLIKGYSNKQIADTLFISVHTVVTHRKKYHSEAQHQIHRRFGDLWRDS